MPSTDDEKGSPARSIDDKKPERSKELGLETLEDDVDPFNLRTPDRAPRNARTSARAPGRSRIMNDVFPSDLVADAATLRNKFSTNRDDLVVRHRVRDIIAELLAAEDANSDPYATLELLEDCADQCEQAGVPIALVLDEDIDAFGAPPLVAQILRMKWSPDELSPTLQFLLEFSNERRLGFYIRRAAAQRGDNAFFQFLRHHIPEQSLAPGTVPIFDSHVDETDADSFAVTVQVHGFAALLRDAAANVAQQERAADKSAPDVAGAVEFIVSERAWELRIGENSLSLRLLQGSPAVVDARCVVLARESHELLLPHGTLHPLSASGQHAVQLKPCFSSLTSTPGSGPASLTDPAAMLDSGELHLQLRVTLRDAPSASSSAEPKLVASELSDDEWEAVDSVKEPQPDQGWVKASWSGRDEDL